MLRYSATCEPLDAAPKMGKLNKIFNPPLHGLLQQNLGSKVLKSELASACS